MDKRIFSRERRERSSLDRGRLGTEYFLKIVDILQVTKGKVEFGREIFLRQVRFLKDFHGTGTFLRTSRYRRPLKLILWLKYPPKVFYWPKAICGTSTNERPGLGFQWSLLISGIDLQGQKPVAGFLHASNIQKSINLFFFWKEGLIMICNG